MRSSLPRPTYQRLAAPIIGTVLCLATILMASSCAAGGSDRNLTIVSGSENEPLEPLIEEFIRQKGGKIEMVYKGSVDMMLELSGENFPYDAVWPANGLWVDLGDDRRRVSRLESVMTSPVAFGVRRSLARELGWIGSELRVADILQAIRAGKLRFMMTSATQSNSGASAYLGFLYALAGNPPVLGMEHLRDPAVVSGVKELLSGINRSSGSSGWLKELFLAEDYDAMVNYEAVLIETNLALAAAGREPLHIVYPVDGIVMADSPLGFVDRLGGKRREAYFLEFQKWLLDPEVQDRLGALGRRTGFGGGVPASGAGVFKAEWGIDTDRVIAPVKVPARAVIEEALRLYQSDFRKPSLTVFALDYSGSMEGEGEAELERAMSMLLDPEESGRYLLQPSDEDVMVVYAFSDRILERWTLEGNDSEGLKGLLSRIRGLAPGGATDIYGPVVEGMRAITSGYDLSRYIPAVILMTDGENNRGSGAAGLSGYLKTLEADIPVFTISFAAADESELKGISELTRGRYFDGKKDLMKAFRSAKGYN